MHWPHHPPAVGNRIWGEPVVRDAEQGGFVLQSCWQPTAVAQLDGMQIAGLLGAARILCCGCSMEHAYTCRLLEAHCLPFNLLDGLLGTGPLMSAQSSKSTQALCCIMLDLLLCLVVVLFFRCVQ